MHLNDSQLKTFASSQTDNFICIDTETTGLKPGKDEVLSIAIVNQNGDELFNQLIKPSKRKRWPDATKVHGITWDDVKDAKELWEYEKELMPIFENATLVVGYNLDFDLSMLKAGGAVLPVRNSFDLMREYAAAYGEWMEWKQDYKWEKLTDCASRYGYEFEAHDALNDARATAYCYKAFIAECKDAWEIREAEIVETNAKKHKMIAIVVAVFLGLFLIGSGLWPLVILIVVIAILVYLKKRNPND